MVEIYRVTRARRVAELLVSPWLAILGAAFPAYFFAKLLPLVGEGIAFLRQGLEAWVAATPLLIVVPFLTLYMIMCLRVVADAWLDAFSSATVVSEGSVTDASSNPFAFSSGGVFITGTANYLSIDGRCFTSLPTGVVKSLHPGDHVRVVHTPRFHYVVAVQRSK